jgi:hypothetical protein
MTPEEGFSASTAATAMSRLWSEFLEHWPPPETTLGDGALVVEHLALARHRERVLARLIELTIRTLAQPQGLVPDELNSVREAIGRSAEETMVALMQLREERNE